jgi:hypothetical protein
VDESLITAGTDEVFLDDIVAFAEMAGANDQGSKIQLLQCAGEAHVGFVVDLVAGVKDGEMREGTLKFLKQLR